MFYITGFGSYSFPFHIKMKCLGWEGEKGGWGRGVGGGGEEMVRF